MAITPTRERLAPEIFRLPVEKIREGYYSDAYFNYAKELLEADGHHPHVVMQIFQRKESVLGGIDEAIAVLKQCSGHRGRDGRWVNGFKELEVNALYEGDEIAPWETVMTIEGDYALFAHLETVYLGCMARRTLIMRNVHEVVEAANGVNPELVWLARDALDAHGRSDVKIVVSGGFNADRIRTFEAEGVPVDAYGVGSSLIRGSNDFTADVVIVEGRPCAKVGRTLRPNPRLERVD